jgi:predicted nucleic acid-binding protein
LKPSYYGAASEEAARAVRAIVYDTGVLIAAERGERRVWAEHRARLEAGMVPCVPSPVIAQASCSPRQVQLRRLLRGCEVVAFTEADGHRAGALLAKWRTADVVDATVVALAVEPGADIQTSDADDIRRLIEAGRAKLAILAL